MSVVVVGGGIIGLASAYYLARAGVEVTVYDKSTIGTAGSTPRSVGGIRTQFSSPVNVALSLESLRVWNTFEEQFGVDIGFRQIGYLYLTGDEATETQLRENVAMQSELGAATDVVASNSLADIVPRVDASRYRVGTFSPTDGIADPHSALQGFATASQEAGATVRPKRAVTDVFRDGPDGRVTGIEADGERVEANYVVNAAGPWAGDVAAMVGIDLPLSLKRHQIAVVDPAEPVPESLPLVVDLDTGSYFRPERDGAALVGGYFGVTEPEPDADAYTKSIDLDWAADAVEGAAAMADYFGPKTQIRDGWAGLCTHTPDDNPIVEETIPGLITVAGFSGHGFQHSPAIGSIVADLVTDTPTPSVDVSALGSDRFDRDAGLSNMRTTEKDVI